MKVNMASSDYLKLILIYMYLFIVRLKCEEDMSSNASVAKTTWSPILTSVSVLDSEKTNYRLPLDELTQTYFQYNQYCGHSCVLNTYPTGQVSCCEECSCNLSTCNNIITQSTCCPDLLNKLDVYPPSYQKCIHPLVFSWQSNQPLPNATLMVVSCPSGAPVSLAEKCENRIKYESIEYKTPYTLLEPISHTVTVYRNKYCLECWHDPDVVNKATRWRLSVLCARGKIHIEQFNEATLTKDVQDNKDCSLVFTSPTQLPSEIICGQGVAECNITGKWHRSDVTTDIVCQAFRAPFRNIYRNLFCFLCNTGDDISSSSFTNCNEDQRVNISFILMTSFYLRNRSLDNENGNYLEDTGCLDGDIMDNIQNKCLVVTCRFYKVFDTTTKMCKPLVEVIGGLKLVIVLKLLPATRDCDVLKLSEVTVRDFIGRMFTRMTNTSGVTSGISVYRIGNDKLCRPSSHSLNEDVISDLNHFVVKIKVDFPVKENSSEMGKMSGIEVFVISLHGENIVIVESRSRYKFKVFIDGSLVNIANSSDVKDSIESENLTDDLRTLHVTDTCPGVILDLTKYNLTYDSSGIFLNSFRIYYFDFVFTNDSNEIRICVHTFERFQAYLVPSVYFLPSEITISSASGLWTLNLIMNILTLVVFIICI